MHGTPPHPPDCMPSTICLALLCTLPKADAGTRNAQGFKNVAANQFDREVFSVFFSFPFPKVPRMEFAVLMEHQLCCLQSYIFESQDLEWG